MDNNQNNLVPVGAENAVAVAEQANKYTSISMWTDKEVFNQVLRVADMLSKTSIIPEKFQGKPQDCFVAVEMASRMDVSPMFVMQNLSVIKGKPSWLGQACIAIINTCPKFKDVRKVRFGKEGTDERGCYYVATNAKSGELIEGPKVTIAMAKAEGWTSNPKWRSMPDLMLEYRSAAFFARTNCPEKLMGLQTVDEIEDISNSSAAANLTEALKGGNE